MVITKAGLNQKLYDAISKRNIISIKKYIEAGADVNNRDCHWGPLYKAIGMNYEEGVSLLISAVQM